MSDDPRVEAALEAETQYTTSGMCHFNRQCDLCDCFFQEDDKLRQHYADRERGRMGYLLAAADAVDPVRLFPEDDLILQAVAYERDAARAELAQYKALLDDFAAHGLRCDLTPTMDCSSVGRLYTGFALYLKRLDQSVRERSAAALSGEDQ